MNVQKSRNVSLMRSLCVTGASTTLDFHPLVALNQPRLFTLAHLHPHPGLLVTLLIIASSSSLPPLYSLKEGLHVRNVNIKYEAYLSKCPKRAIIASQWRFFVFLL